MISIVNNLNYLTDMKRALLYTSFAIALAFLFVSCEKESNSYTEDGVSKNSQFELIAKPLETKTANDGMDTKWVAEDAINVFHAKSGTTSYVSDGKYTISETNLTTNTFTGTVSDETFDEEASYDWYMFYPYTSQIVTPANDSKGYVIVGSDSKSSFTQTQQGNNSKTHIAGSNYPLFGKIAGVAGNTTPKVSVKQACAFIEFNVKNESGSDLVVSDIEFTATEDIVGTYYINYSNPDKVKYTSSGDKYVSKTAILSVGNGTAISNGSSATFYIGIKPFTASEGKLIVSVNGLEKTINISSSTSFSAGKIKKINYSFDNASRIIAEDINDIAVAGGSFTAEYQLENIEKDDVVAVPDGIVVTKAAANNGTVTFSVAPNYTISAKTGKITLSSASTGASKVISVGQLKSSGLKVSENTIVIPADATTATFTVTTADFGWNADVTTLEGMNLSINPTSGSASADAQTVTITSTTAATNEAQDLGTILIYRNGNTADSGKKTVTVKKAAVAVAGLYTLNGTITGGTSGYATESEITQDGVSWMVMGNTTMSPWRIGGKGAAVRTVYSSTSIKFDVAKIEIEHGTCNLSVNSMTVIVASDKTFENVVSTLAPTFIANGTVTIERPTDVEWNNCFYKIIYDVTASDSSNQFIQFKGATFTK